MSLLLKAPLGFCKDDSRGYEEFRREATSARCRAGGRGGRPPPLCSCPVFIRACSLRGHRACGRGETRHFFSDARKEVAKAKCAKEGALTAAPSCGISPVAGETSGPCVRRSARIVPGAVVFAAFCGRDYVRGLIAFLPAADGSPGVHKGPAGPLRRFKGFAKRRGV